MPKIPTKKQKRIKIIKKQLRRIKWNEVAFSSICLAIVISLFYLVFIRTSVKPYDYTTLAVSWMNRQITDLKTTIQNAPISRANFVDVMVNTAYPESKENIKYDCFKDVSEKTLYADSICMAKSKGILNTFHSNQFKPSQTITFVEALRIAMDSLEYGYSDEDAPWYKDVISKASELNFIPLTITDIEQLLAWEETADMLSRMLKGDSYVADETVEEPFFKVTYQTLSQGQDVLERMELGKRNQCFYGGLYYNNSAEFRHINEDNSCSDCTCINGDVACEPVACEPDPIEEIRPEGQYEFTFQECNSDNYKPATINILDEWENLEDIRLKVDKIKNGRRYVQDILGNYDVCMASQEKERLMTQLSQPYGLNLDNRNFLIHVAHFLFIFQQDLFENLDYQFYSKEDISNLGWNTEEPNWTNYQWASTKFRFSEEFYKLFPLAIQLADRNDSEDEMVKKLSYWLERNLVHYYRESKSGHNPGGNKNYGDNLYGSKCYFRCKRKAAFYLEDFFAKRVGGCHVSSGMLAALARSIGIPLESSNKSSHGYVHFYRPNLYVHGDMTALLSIWPAEVIVHDQDTWDMKDTYAYMRKEFPEEKRVNYLLMMMSPRFNENGEWAVETVPTIMTRLEKYNPCMMTRKEVMQYKELIAEAYPEFDLVFTNDRCRQKVDENGRFTGWMPDAHEAAFFRVTSNPIKIKSLDEHYHSSYFSENSEEPDFYFAYDETTR